MTTDKIIHRIHAATWTRFDKWRVELEIRGEKKRVCWLTHTQYEYLVGAFARTENGYSTKSTTVVGTFDSGKGYFIRCHVGRPVKPRDVPVVEEGQIDPELLDAIS